MKVKVVKASIFFEFGDDYMDINKTTLKHIAALIMNHKGRILDGIKKKTKSNNVGHVIICLLLLLLATYLTRNAFETNFIEDSVIDWCIASLVIVFFAIVLYCNYPKIRLLSITIVFLAVVSTVQIAVFRLNCKTVIEKSEGIKYKTVYELAKNSVLSDNKNSKQYVILKIADEYVKLYLYKSEYKDFSIIQMKNVEKPFVEDVVYNKISVLAFNNKSHSIMTFIYITNPLARHLLHIRDSEEYHYYVVNLS